MIGTSLRLPQLGPRLQQIADCVPRCQVAADIGADHGRLSGYLLSQGICKRMIVSDISPDSLNKSRRLLKLHGLSDCASFIVADGLEAVEEPVDAVIISGIGGKTISDMLQKHHRIAGARLIISPQTDQALLRKTLADLGYTLKIEFAVRASGRFYTVIEAVRGVCEYSAQQLYIGHNLSDNDGTTVFDYLKWRRDVVSTNRDPKKELYLAWLNEEIDRAKNCNQ